jgi:Zn-dependent protease with chaperone function
MFVLSVIAIVIAVNVALGALYLGFAARPGAWARDGLGALPPYFIPTTTIVVILIIAGGTAFEMLALREGGEAVARMVGARAVDPSTGDLLERRLLNVVEEMALASGVAMPRVYVLDKEDAINAFAAGLTPNDAVVAVTRGTLTRLTRDELQGVIGHEFSHILHGDMALNVHLIGLLHGLLALALFGRFLMEIGGRGRARDSRGGVVFLLGMGIAIWVLGWIGVFCGRLIKASVSRQREFLADASSVQFTRNPDGIGGALRKIGGLAADRVHADGSAIAHPHAETLSHMFMAPAKLSFAAGLWATHPPLEERIRRIYGRVVEFLPAPEQPLALALAEASKARPAAPELAPLEFAAVSSAAAASFARATAVSPVSALVGQAGDGAALGAAVGHEAPAPRSFVDSLHAKLDAIGLRAALADTLQAQLVVLAMLIDKKHAVSGQQRRAVIEAFGQPAGQRVDAVHEQLSQLPPGWRLPLLDLALPALRKLSEPGRARLLLLAHTLIVADGRVTLPEFLLFTVLKRRLGKDAERRAAVKYRPLAQLQPQAALVLSLIAAVRLPDDAQRAYNAGILLAPGVDVARTSADAIALDRVADALAQLNLLAPLAKPQFIKACSAAAFVDGRTNWQAASCLRTICAALDAPLPPQVEQVQTFEPSAEAAVS